MYRKHKEWFEENNKVTDDEINKYYEEHKDEFIKADAAHILVEDEETAKEVKNKLDNGESFESLAKEYSKDTASAKNGGELGQFAKGAMIKEFEDKVFSMNEGEVSEPIKTQFGYHVIKLNSITDSVEDSKEEITKKIKDKKYQDYIAKLHDDANVVTEGNVTEENKESEAKEESDKEKENKEQEKEQTEKKDAQNDSENKEEKSDNK